MSKIRSYEDLTSANYIVSGEELITCPYPSRMFDRIINVKFQRKSRDEVGNKQYFTIRSDYELQYNRDKTVSIAKCSQKPSMHLSYKQVANDIAISVVLKVGGLYIDRELTGEEIDSADGNPVEWMTIQMGYFDEFPAWDKITTDDDLKRFFELEDRMKVYGKQLRVQVLNCYPEGSPPDRVWVFNGVVATLETGLRWEPTAEMLVPNYGNDSFPKDMSKIEAMLYQWITRRFVRPEVESEVVLKTLVGEDGSSYQEVESIKIRGYYHYFDNTADPLQWEKLDLDNDGLMTMRDANMFGVRCHCSEKLRNIVATFDPNRLGMTGGKTVADALGSLGASPVDYTMFNEQHLTLGPQINAIKKQFGFLRWYPLTSGDIYFYHRDQSTRQMYGDNFVTTGMKENALKLAAVYDITVSGTRTIRCPFTRFIDPMTTILFQSRYRTIDSVGFYTQPKRGMDAFLALLVSIEFSTDDESNEMSIMCVDIDPAEAPVVDFDRNIVTPGYTIPKSEQTYSGTNKTKIADYRSRWAKVSFKVGQAPFASAGLSWVDVARHLVQCAKPDDWNGVLPSLAVALAKLKEWNSSVWASHPDDGNGNEHPDNDLNTGYSGVIPYLMAGDIVVIHQPFLENEGTEQKEIVLYE